MRHTVGRPTRYCEARKRCQVRATVRSCTVNSDTDSTPQGLKRWTRSFSNLGEESYDVAGGRVDEPGFGAACSAHRFLNSYGCSRCTRWCSRCTTSRNR